jgi:hypothetical protein
VKASEQFRTLSQKLKNTSRAGDSLLARDPIAKSDYTIRVEVAL